MKPRPPETGGGSKLLPPCSQAGAPGSRKGLRQRLGAWEWGQGRSQHSLSPSSQETTHAPAAVGSGPHRKGWGPRGGLRGAGLEETPPGSCRVWVSSWPPQRGCPPRHPPTRLRQTRRGPGPDGGGPQPRRPDAKLNVSFSQTTSNNVCAHPQRWPGHSRTHWPVSVLRRWAASSCGRSCPASGGQRRVTGVVLVFELQCWEGDPVTCRRQNRSLLKPAEPLPPRAFSCTRGRPAVHTPPAHARPAPRPQPHGRPQSPAPPHTPELLPDPVCEVRVSPSSPRPGSRPRPA